MEIKILNKTQDKLVFTVNGINSTLANTLRRLMAVEVPVLAIDLVEFTKNSSALYDEIIAHRLGLVPLKTDLKSYDLKDECKCKGKGCALCELKLTLKAEGPGIVYASQLKSADPKVVPAYPDLPIVELAKKQALEFTATAILGKGKTHAKFSPGLIYYRGYPMFDVKDKSKLKKVEEELKDVITVKNDNVVVKDILKWNERYEEILDINDVQVNNSKENFIFYVESWGQLKPEEIVKKAFKVFEEKLDDFEAKLKKAK